MPIIEKKFTIFSESRFHTTVKLSDRYCQLSLHKVCLEFQFSITTDDIYSHTRVAYGIANAVMHLPPSLLNNISANMKLAVLIWLHNDMIVVCTVDDLPNSILAIF